MTSKNEPSGHFATGNAQFTTGEEQRGINNSSTKNEVAWPKQKQCSVMDVSCGVSKSLMLH